MLIDDKKAVKLRLQDPPFNFKKIVLFVYSITNLKYQIPTNYVNFLNFNSDYLPIVKRL